MYNVRKVTEDIVWVGASDRRLALFENIFPIPRGVSYNSYVLLDEKRCFWIQSMRPWRDSFLKIWSMCSTDGNWII